MVNNKKLIIGWTGVFITVIFSSLWAYWGAIENFHEGWYSTSVCENILMFLFQYMLIHSSHHQCHTRKIDFSITNYAIGAGNCNSRDFYKDCMDNQFIYQYAN